jgi:hypothetical protein
MPKKKPAPPKEVATPVSAPAQWHKRTAVVTGELSYAVIKRKMLKSDVARWRDELISISNEMNNLLGGTGASST